MSHTDRSIYNGIVTESDLTSTQEQEPAPSSDGTGPVSVSRPLYAQLSDTARGLLGPIYEWVKEHRYLALGHAATLVVLLAVVGVLVLRDQAEQPLWQSYADRYRLVPETISQSAAIAVSLPAGVRGITEEQLEFEPPLAGSLIDSGRDEVMFFTPSTPPEVGSFYRVVLSYSTTTIAADFLVAEDPRVVSILPSDGAETHEMTEVSVIFNRPMVPLSTLGVLEQQAVPVKLEPSVPGVWKWKSTRLLQFVPDEDLARATRYRVSVHEGFRSLDGVPVQGFTHSFTTRTLKQDPVPGSVRFDQPLVLSFNQPVDLKRTAAELRLMKDGKPIEAIVSYGKRPVERPKVLGLTLFSDTSEVDTAKLEVRPIRDVHGRKGFWDFESSYSLALKKKYPLEGDIIDETPLSWSYRLPSALSSIEARSARSAHVAPLFFDPQGELIVRFEEPVRKDQTVITLQGLRDKSYAKKCRLDEDGNEVYDRTTRACEQIDDTSALRLVVDSSAYRPGEDATISLDRIVSEAGHLLNARPIVRQLRIVPELQLLRTIPEDGARVASLTELTLCTNAPLARPEKIRNTVVTTSGYIVYPDQAWQNSRRVEHDKDRCKRGEFQTTIQYGLHPETDYALALLLTDEFGRTAARSLVVRTEAVRSKYTRFHTLQKWYNVTVPGKTRLTYATENLPAVIVHMCKVSGVDLLRILEKGSLDNGLPPASLCKEVRTTTIDLPDTFWVNNYFYFDMKDHFTDTRGHYLITFTHPTYRNEKGVQQYEHTLMSVTNLAVGEKRIDWYRYGEVESTTRQGVVSASNLYWVVDAETLEPVEGATVAAYAGTAQFERTRALVQSGTARTDGAGVARIPARENARGAVVTLGNESAVVSAGTDTLLHAGGVGAETATYLYTDRPIYRPGDVVHVKGVDRVGYDHNWTVPEAYRAAVEVTNSRGDVIAKQTVPVSIYGTFDLSLTLPKDAPLGTYYIRAFEGGGWFDVEEYVGAPFRVEVTPKEQEYVAGETAELSVSGQYYFDMPVANGAVEYTVLAQDYHFDRYTDEYFSFGSGWYSCYWCGYGDSFITRGTTQLDERGKATIKVPLTFAKYFDDPNKTGSKLFTVIARVQDETGKQVSGQQTVIVHRGDHYLGVRTETYMAGKNEDVSVRVKSVDTDGSPISVRGITLTAARVEWESYKRREVDGGYYWHSEEKRMVVEERNLSTDRAGNAASTFRFAEPGTYELAVQSTDRHDNRVQATTRLYVYGEGQVAVRPMNNETLSVTLDKASYKTGEEATLLAESPFAEARALITIERGDVYQYWSTKVNGSFLSQKIPIHSAYAPSVYASVLLLGKNFEVKFGTRELVSDTTAHGLRIEVTPSKSAYVPGEEVELVIRTKDHAGQPVQADVSVAVVDLSVLALKGNPKKNPAAFFYGGLPLAVSTAHSAKNMLTEQDVPTGTKGGGGGEDLERRKRGDFKDTAHWQAQVVTDEHGEARIRFTLPDNLTTWQVESLGVTADTKVGVHYLEFLSNKRLMAVPIRPRFVVPGDVLWLGLQVVNNTDRDLTLATAVSSDTLTLHDTGDKRVTVRAGKQSVVYFKAEAPRAQKSGIHTVTFRATHPNHEDVVEQRIPVLADVMYEVTATAGMSGLARVFESVYIPEYALPDEGELIVQARPTLVASITDGIRDLVGYPYGCSEQIASRLASLATVRRIGKIYGDDARTKVQTMVFEGTSYSLDEAVQAGLVDLLGRQHPAGGFSFYPGAGYPSPHLTVEVLRVLTVLRDAGYPVADAVFDRATSYLLAELASQARYDGDRELVARIAMALASPYVSATKRAELAPRVRVIAMSPRELEQLSSTALGYLAVATEQGPYDRAIKDQFFAALNNRLTIDARGAFVKSAPNGRRSWFESDAKNTALLLHTIALRGGTHPTLDNILRWILASKQAGGGWGSTNATFEVLDAVLRITEVRKEHQADHLLTLLLDDASIATHRVTPTTVLDSLTYTFPIGSFTREHLHQVSLTRSEGDGTMYYDMQLRYALPPDMVPPRDEGFTVQRTLALHGTDQPISEAKVGSIVTGTLDITVPRNARAVSIESYVPAGFEIVNFALSTESSADLVFNDDGVRLVEAAQPYRFEPTPGPLRWPVSYEEMHDDRVFVFAEEVPAGRYMYTYTLRALVPGTYRHLPATVQEMYTPEVFGRTSGGTFTIKER